VQQLKDALETEQSRLAEVSDASIQAIGSLLSMSQWVLGILAILLAVIAIVGWITIYRAALAACRNMAKNHLESYINSEAFRNLVSDKIERQLEKEWENRLVSTTLDRSDKEANDPSPFPQAEEKGGAQ